MYVFLGGRGGSGGTGGVVDPADDGEYGKNYILIPVQCWLKSLNIEPTFFSVLLQNKTCFMTSQIDFQGSQKFRSIFL